MLLSTYKRKMKNNVMDLAKKFGVSHATMYQWIKSDAEIRGKSPNRVITTKKEFREVATEKGE